MAIHVMINGIPRKAFRAAIVPKQSPVILTVVEDGQELTTHGGYSKGKSKTTGELKEYTYFTTADGSVFYLDGRVDPTSAIVLVNGVNPIPPLENLKGSGVPMPLPPAVASAPVVDEKIEEQVFKSKKPKTKGKYSKVAI